MNHFLKITFFLIQFLVCAEMVTAKDESIDEDLIISNIIIKGRMKDPSLRNDYVYLRYLSDLLFFTCLQKRYAEGMSEDHLKDFSQNIIQRIGTIMVGGGSGLKKRSVGTINPDLRWQTINNLALIVQVDHQYDLHVNFATFFDELSQKVRVTKNGISNEDFQNHLSILKGILVAEAKTISLPIIKNEQEEKERLAFCLGEVAKVLNEAMKERAFFYIEEFGVGQGMRHWKRQIKRVKNFYTYRQSLGLSIRMILGVSNDARYLEERERFSDDAWIVWDHEDSINPGGPIGLGADFTINEQLEELIKQNVVFDDISIDDAVLHQARPDLTFAHKISQLITEGGTFHFPLGFGYDLVQENGQINLDESAEKIANDIVTKLNFFKGNGKIFPVGFNPRLRLSNEFRKYDYYAEDHEKRKKFKDVETKINEKYYLAYYKAMLANPGIKQRKWFKKIELKEGKDHPLKIYSLPLFPMIVATK